MRGVNGQGGLLRERIRHWYVRTKLIKRSYTVVIVNSNMMTQHLRSSINGRRVVTSYYYHSTVLPHLSDLFCDPKYAKHILNILKITTACPISPELILTRVSPAVPRRCDRHQEGELHHLPHRPG